jgi:hypothetical protein
MMSHDERVITAWTWLDRGTTALKYVTSCLAVVLSVLVVVYGIAMDYNMGNFGGPAAEFFLFFASLTLLAANEGFQVGNKAVSSIIIIIN